MIFVEEPSINWDRCIATNALNEELGGKNSHEKKWRRLRKASPTEPNLRSCSDRCNGFEWGTFVMGNAAEGLCFFQLSEGKIKENDPNTSKMFEKSSDDKHF